MRKSHSGRKKTPAKKAETLRERCRKLFRLTPIQLTVAWRQVTEKESGTASYAAALAEFGRTTKSPEVQASKVLRLAKVQEAMAWLRRELGIIAGESAEEFAAARQRADTIRFLRWACGASPSKVLSGGFVLDERGWLKLPEEVRDLVTEVEIETVLDTKGKAQRFIKKFKVLDRMKAQAMLIDLYGLKKMDPGLLAILEKLGTFAAKKARKG